MNKATLEAQANAIEAALAAHGIAGQVTGGTVTPKWVRFTVEMPNAKEQWTVDHLLTGLAYCHRPYTAALGIAEDGAPLLVNLDSAEGAHILITGKERAELLNIVTESLRRWNGGDDLLVGSKVLSASEALPVLAKGIRVGVDGPMMALPVELDEGTPYPLLCYVAKHGPPTGLHLLATTERATAGVEVLFPTRIKGLGGGRFLCVAPDFRGAFQAPTDGRGKEVMLSSGDTA
ncbi:MAG: hypothetical protein DRI80_13320 [Chloroflexota bacterium]|nr:MAG: hypothetical protein DRI80_13320 [Chloroflexota bacterium]